MGTPSIAVPCLETLIKSKHDVVGVFTQPDRPKGRGHRVVPTPIKEIALRENIPVYQPLSLRRGDDATTTFETLCNLKPDLIVVMAYGQILPREILQLPQYHCINMHASLLPKYRGASPIPTAILNGETETGITAMQMAEGLDTGDILLQKKIPIDPEEDTDTLSNALAELAAETICEVLVQIELGTLKAIPQNDAKATVCGKITKDMMRLDFTHNATQLHNQIRAITGYIILDGERLKVYASHVVESQHCASGTAIIEKEKMIIECGEGTALELREVAAEGKRRMVISDFLRGRRFSNTIMQVD